MMNVVACIAGRLSACRRTNVPSQLGKVRAVDRTFGSMSFANLNKDDIFGHHGDGQRFFS